ncbi:uncharacterized protein AC631_01577 [Debaryomyces fabryi]|uniref:Secretory component protein SHR3 n=1 Tax=Debaryomyces fabryi TaxID=58627 RepID=A0A0V1Q2G5_9ASCO|nr:uncharacterized protein AC631_01577 [Debaryomyces fabryi]KSA02688.1 hypothetical protein AC631_01577 [Debaryomyces fabryi]CUM45653.1 unnamed protein product [Debaryomyces fabryi]
MAYKDIVPVGSALIIGATSFGLGVFYANLPYDLNTLWRHDETGNAFITSLAHYSIWGNSPAYVHHIFHFVMALGFIGAFIKLYKPSEDAKYFEYGSLFLYMVGVIIYLTNLRIGVNSCLAGEWGEVDMPTGINVMAASQVMIGFALFGVLLLQGGLYYAEWYDNKLKQKFFEEEERAALVAASAKTDTLEETEEIKSKGSSASGASASSTKAKSKKKSK